MRSTTKKVLSVFLVLVFGSFSIGVPVVQYLCPMMSGDNPSCDMSPVSAAGQLTFSTVTPDCCAKKLGAERNTTPFLKVEKLQSLAVDVLVSTSAIAVAEPEIHYSNIPLLHFSSSSPPLFVLHSALLI